MSKKKLTEEEIQKRRNHCRIIAVNSRKGGVGKTTSTLNIAGWLAKGYKDPSTGCVMIPKSKVLIIDFDNQMNVSNTALSNNPDYGNDSPTLFDWFLSKEDPIPSYLEGYKRKPSFTKLQQLETILNRRDVTDYSKFEVSDIIYDAFRPKKKNGEEVGVTDYRLDVIPNYFNAEYDIFEQVNIGDLLDEIWSLRKSEYAYDYIFIDCGPGSGELNEDAMRYADYLLVPTDDTNDSIDGVKMVLQLFGNMRKKDLNSIQRCAEHLNSYGYTVPDLTLAAESIKSDANLLGIFFPNYNRHSPLYKSNKNELKKKYPYAVLKHDIPNLVISTKDAHDAGLPLCWYSSRSAGAIAYRDLTIEILSKICSKEDRG